MGEYFLISAHEPVGPFSSLDSIRPCDIDDQLGDLHWVTYECDIGGAVSLRQAFDEAMAVQERLLADVDQVRRATATTLEAVRDRIYGVDRLEIAQLLSRVGTAQSSNSKGKALEDLVLRLLRSMPGFSPEVRRRNSTEEIDIEVVNDSDETFWKKSGDIVLVECKNQAKPCGKEALSGLRDKMRHRRGRCDVGILVSWSGFTRTVRRHDARDSTGDQAMLLLDRNDLEEAVSAGIEPVLRRAFLAAIRE